MPSYAVADCGRTHKIPANNMSFAQAATLPVALQTMHNAVVTAGRLKAGETVLIQGASSGVGLLAMQIAKHKGARLVIGSSTNAGAARAVDGVRCRSGHRLEGPGLGRRGAEGDRTARASI